MRSNSCSVVVDDAPKANVSLLVVGTSAATYVGFNSLADPINNPNSWDSLLWLACLYSIVPAIFKFIAIPMLWNYSLTEEKLAEVQAEIEKSAATAPS